MILKSLAGFSIVALASIASAQSYDARGRGDYSVAGDRQRIERASVSFASGTFSLSLGVRGGRQVVVDGTASRSGNRRSVVVTMLDGISVRSGRGTIVLDDDTLQSVKVSGGDGSDRYSIDFNADRSSDAGRPPRPGWPSLPGDDAPSGDTSGKGSIQRGNDRDDLKKMFFSLNDDNSFKITLQGRGMNDVVFVGRWSGRGDTRNLQLRGTLAGRLLSGGGTIRLSSDRKEVRRLNIDGRIGNDRLTIDFRDN